METAIEILRTAKSLAVITGAGISAESGIPTFRGDGGLWRTYRAEDLATPGAFRRDPKLVWEWYQWRRKICHGAQPNPAHLVVADMETSFDPFLLITQNVDGLHRRAGSGRLLEIHGNIFQGRCTRCERITPLEETPLPVIPPACPSCGAMLRPHIVWFGETYFPGILEKAFSFLEKTDAIIIIGTSGAVMTPVQLALYAIQHGARSIDVNPEPSQLSPYVDVHLKGAAGDLLPGLWDHLRQ